MLLIHHLNHIKNTQPPNWPTAGSTFRNPKDTFAAKLIEECGLKGFRVGNAEVSEKHANFIVNLGNAKAKDVVALMNLAKKKVKDKFKINLETEVQFVGFK